MEITKWLILKKIPCTQTSFADLIWGKEGEEYIKEFTAIF